MGEAMLWNVEQTESVRASKIRNFGIYKNFPSPSNSRKLLGWFNANESFHFGVFDTEYEARIYLARIHEQIEGKK